MSARHLQNVLTGLTFPEPVAGTKKSNADKGAKDVFAKNPDVKVVAELEAV